MAHSSLKVTISAFLPYPPRLLSTQQRSQNFIPSTQLQENIFNKNVHKCAFHFQKTESHSPVALSLHLSFRMWYYHTPKMQNKFTELYYHYTICNCRNSPIHSRKNLHAFTLKLLILATRRILFFQEILTQMNYFKLMPIKW